MFLRILLLIYFISVSYGAFARPVSYPEGWTFMTKNNEDINSALIHYSPTSKYSLGYRIQNFKHKKYQLHALHYNHLIKRWNKKHTQANFYTKSGNGIAYSDYENYDSKKKIGGYIGISSDWETRRYYVSYENVYSKSGNFDDYFKQKFKVGIAPYISNYGSLHTWVMLEVDHNPESKSSIRYTPLLRFFKGTHMVEAGISNKKKVLLNYIVRF